MLKKKSIVHHTAFYPWLVCFLGACFYCYEYYLRISPSVMAKDLMRAYDLNGLSFGNLTAFYYYAYTPMQFFVGILMDRFGPRRLLTFACFCCAAGAFCFGSSQVIWIAALGRFLIGFGSAFAFVGALKLATMWLPPERFGFIACSVTTLGMFGAIIGDDSLTLLVEHVGWRPTLYISGTLGVVLAVTLFLGVRDKEHSVNETEALAPSSFRVLFSDILIAIRNPQLWIVGLIGGLMYLPITAIAELWGIPYFTKAYHLDPEHAANLNAMIFLGWAVAGPFMGTISDRIKRRKLPLLLGVVCATILITVILYVPHLNYVTLCVLLFAFGISSSVQSLAFVVSREVSSQKISGTVIAFTNMLVMLGGMIAQPTIGAVLDCFWKGAMVNGVRVFSVFDYQVALSIIPVGLCVGFVLSLFLRETFCQLSDD